MTYEPDFREELDTCLEVLVEQADRLVGRRQERADHPPLIGGWIGAVEVPDALLTEDDEQITALYQTIELVSLLTMEHDTAWQTVGVLRKALFDASSKKQKGRGLWTPRIELPVAD